MTMTLEERRQQALPNAILGLERLASQHAAAELRPGSGGPLDALMHDFAERLEAIDAAEAAHEAAQQRPAQTFEGRVADTMAEMVARGLGRI